MRPRGDEVLFGRPTPGSSGPCRLDGVIQPRMNSAARVSSPDGSGRALTPRPCRSSITPADHDDRRGTRSQASPAEQRLHRGQCSTPRCERCKTAALGRFGPGEHHLAVRHRSARISARARAGDAGDRDRRRARPVAIRCAAPGTVASASDVFANSIQVASAEPSGSNSISTRPSDPPSSIANRRRRRSCPASCENAAIGLALIVL